MDELQLRRFLSALGDTKSGAAEVATTPISMRTQDMSLISHTHGRERRAERGILRAELQAAIKYGKRERANPGRNNQQRWRYTYDGVVYITDDTSRHEITSWRIDGKDANDMPVVQAEIDLGGKGTHAVLIVDSSGSMRKDDVPGYPSRTAAVYDCLARDFAEAQLASGAADDVVVTLIAMSSAAEVVFTKAKLDRQLVNRLKNLGKGRARNDGNYLPALDKAIEIMRADAPNRASMLLCFLSDGAPSDHSEQLCPHGVRVWQRREDGAIDAKSGKPKFQDCVTGWPCRTAMIRENHSKALRKIRTLGDLFGRERVVVSTVAFGPPKEDFRLLQEMAEVLPRGSFQKLGLNAEGLRTAFSSLSSSMSTLRTEGGSLAHTRRDKTVNKAQRVDTSSDLVHGFDGWWIYHGEDVASKSKYDQLRKELAQVGFSRSAPTIENCTGTATGLAFVEEPFAEGAERFVYRCTEIEVPPVYERTWYEAEALRMRTGKGGKKGAMTAARVGLRLVAKEAKTMENLGRKFHEQFARLQNDANLLAAQFNRRVRGPASWSISFLPIHIYLLFDNNYAGGEMWLLVEPELDGRFTKWNNNAGAVLQSTSPRIVGSASAHALGGIYEEDEDEDEDEEVPITIDDVPQAFSHFSFEASGGKQLVCDLQGVWNEEDGFVLTDPVVHYVSSTGTKHKNGATDQGRNGICKFFKTHKCNALCARLGLKLPPPAVLA